MIEGGSCVQRQKEMLLENATNPQQRFQAAFSRTSDMQMLYISQCLGHKSREYRTA